MLLPVLGIMAATAEWTQRTGLVTFTLEPRRGRVVLAKALAALALRPVVLVGRRRGVRAGQRRRPAPATWDLDAAAGGGLVLALLIYVLQGVAFGLLFLNTPVAIVTVLVLPTVWTIATMVFSALADVGTLDRPGLGHRAAVRRGDGGPGLGPARHRRRRVGAAAAGGRHVAGAHIVR